VRTQLFFCGEAGPQAPRCPLKPTEQSGPNGPESHAVASPWGDLGIHTSGPLYCQADKSSNKHSHANDPQSIKISASKEKATCPIRDTPCHPGRSVPRWQPYRPVPRPSIALCDRRSIPMHSRCRRCWRGLISQEGVVEMWLVLRRYFPPCLLAVHFFGGVERPALQAGLFGRERPRSICRLQEPLV